MIVTGTYRGINYEFDDGVLDQLEHEGIDGMAEFKKAIDEHIEKELYNEINTTNS